MNLEETKSFLREQAQETFRLDRYATETTGIAIVEVGAHEAECSLTVESRHCNARGVAMGGVLYTMGDFTAAVAANSECMRIPDDLCWVSLDATIHYLSAAPMGTSLVAKSHAIKHGRSTALYQTTIENLDNGNQTVAIVESTMMKVG